MDRKTYSKIDKIYKQINMNRQKIHRKSRQKDKKCKDKKQKERKIVE